MKLKLNCAHCGSFFTASLHSFTLSLRHQLRETAIRVIELIPPCVDSPLLPAECKQHTVPVNDFVESSMAQLLQDVVEIGYQSDKILRASRDELDEMFNEWNCGDIGKAAEKSCSQSAQKQCSQEQKSQQSSSQKSPLQI